MQYWLVKSEPDAFSFADLLQQKQAHWDGVRNYQARNFLRQMKRKDQLLFYHSIKEKQIVGVAEVIKEAYPDFTAKEGDWSLVDVKPKYQLVQPVTLQDIKLNPVLQNMPFLKQSRLSVSPVSDFEFKTIIQMARSEKFL